MTNELIKDLEQEKSKLFKQRLQRVHQSVGIIFALFMYIAVFFGIFAILLDYITPWEKPSQHIKMIDPMKIDYGAIVEPVLADSNFPKENLIRIRLPGTHGNTTGVIFTRYIDEAYYFNPHTKKMIQDEGEQSEMGEFLNHMHFGAELGDVGFYGFGFMATAVLFLGISGILLVLKIKYKNSSNTTTSKFSKYHRKIFVWTFAPFILITLTGALINIGFTGSTVMAKLVSKGEAYKVSQLVDQVKKKSEMPEFERKNIPAQMLSINELFEKAKEIAPDTTYAMIALNNWGDVTATAHFYGYDQPLILFNGIYIMPGVMLSAVDGSLIKEHKVMDAHWSRLFQNAIFFFHFLYGVNVWIKLLIATLMSLSLVAIGFGVLLYLEKKNRKIPLHIPTFDWMGRLSLSVMLGVLPATGFLFVSQWLFPIDMENRVTLQKGIFILIWLGTLTWSFYRLNTYQVAKEFLTLGGILFLLSPIVHSINSGFSPIELLSGEMYAILGVDIGLFILGVVLLYVAKKLPVNREKVQEFWTKRLNKGEENR